jgi:predicted ATPase
MSSPPPHRPSFLEEGEPHPVEKPIFVARDRELAQLDGHLDLALEGQGRVVFITGEAGSGKTALVQEFTWRAQEAHPELLVASGNCNAHTGIGDPYLPFREVLGLLTGDVEARWIAGAISRVHARRLWKTLPTAAQALTDHGPTLIDTFVPGTVLLDRAVAYASGGAEWLTSLDELVRRIDLQRAQNKANGLGIPTHQQSYLFDQYTRVLRELAHSASLVIVLDDLQWADTASVGLLFHLGRQLVNSRILIVGAYRSEEISLSRNGDRHPLEPVIHEFQRLFGDILINVDRAESHDFLEALLDSEPNRLGESFRQMLYRLTRGQPLFTIELLRGMQERGDLVQDQEGRWIEEQELNWETMPARVEAVIAERIGRLSQPLQVALRAASVEGDVFTAEVVARVNHTDERELLGFLSNELNKQHRLVRAESIQRVDDQLLSYYRFRHTLVQKYLYNSLDEVERVHLHELVGTTLEKLHGTEQDIPAIALQLARHFQEAKITEKAIHYLHKAGEKAVQLSAYQEGIAHLNTGLESLMTLPDSPERDQQELDLQLALGVAWQKAKGGQALEGIQVYTRARELCQRLGKTSQLCRVLGGMSIFYYVRGEYQRSFQLAENSFIMAQKIKDPLLEMLAHWDLSIVSFSLGEYTTGQDHLKHLISFYDPQQHHYPFVFLRGSDVGLGGLAYDACYLWCLGYPNQAIKRSQQALALAREFDHPFTLADVLCYAGCMFNSMARDAQAIQDYADELIQLAGDKVPGWLGTGIRYRGKALAMLGQIQEGIAQMREGMAIMRSEGIRLYFPGTLGYIAEAQGKSGQPERGLATLDEAIALIEETNERHWEAEIHRLRAETFLAMGAEAEAETSYHTAIEVARRQNAKSWELRATIGLARLWNKQNKSNQAREILGQIYGWFTEGFDTPDLVEAKALLEELD